MAGSNTINTTNRRKKLTKEYVYNKMNQVGNKWGRINKHPVMLIALVEKLHLVCEVNH